VLELAACRAGVALARDSHAAHAELVKTAFDRRQAIATVSGHRAWWASGAAGPLTSHLRPGKRHGEPAQTICPVKATRRGVFCPRFGRARPVRSGSSGDDPDEAATSGDQRRLPLASRVSPAHVRDLHPKAVTPSLRIVLESLSLKDNAVQPSHVPRKSNTAA
jgi:hypothetical protein